jgi:hypothetical protein
MTSSLRSHQDDGGRLKNLATVAAAKKPSPIHVNRVSSIREP